jgi:hypothetical protein
MKYQKAVFFFCSSNSSSKSSAKIGVETCHQRCNKSQSWRRNSRRLEDYWRVSFRPPGYWQLQKYWLPSPVYWIWRRQPRHKVTSLLNRFPSFGNWWAKSVHDSLHVPVRNGGKKVVKFNILYWPGQWFNLSSISHQILVFGVGLNIWTIQLLSLNLVGNLFKLSTVTRVLLYLFKRKFQLSNIFYNLSALEFELFTP